MLLRQGPERLPRENPLQKGITTADRLRRSPLRFKGLYKFVK